MESAEIFEHFPGFFCHIYNLQNIETTNSGTFWSVLQMQLRQEMNMLLRRSYTYLFFI